MALMTKAALEAVFEREGDQLVSDVSAEAGDLLRRGDISAPLFARLVIRTAFQVGIETGLTVAELDRIGAQTLLDSIRAHVHQDDAEEVASGLREAAMSFLRAVHE